jgi:peptide chain release factor subunit 1
VLYLTKDQEKDTENFKDTETGQDLEIAECISLVEWFANNYKRFGANLEFVTNRSQEGSQFCRGFGGIGGESLS